MTAELKEDGQLVFVGRVRCLGPPQGETISVSLLTGVSFVLRVGDGLLLTSAPKAPSCCSNLRKWLPALNLQLPFLYRISNQNLWMVWRGVLELRA